MGSIPSPAIHTMTTPIYDLPELTAGQDGAEVNHNEAIRRLEGFGSALLVTEAENDPPGSPNDGDLYAVGATPTGVWVGHTDEFALYASGWLFATIPTGQLASILDTELVVVWNGTAWITVLDWNP